MCKILGLACFTLQYKNNAVPHVPSPSKRAKFSLVYMILSFSNCMLKGQFRMVHEILPNRRTAYKKVT